MKSHDMPFARGTTPGSTTSTGLIEMEGREVTVWDDTYRQFVQLKCVRNVTGTTVTGKQLLLWKAGQEGKQVDGFARTFNAFSVAVDHEYTGTIANNELFWAVVGGPALLKTPNSDMGVDIAVGDVVAAVTLNTTTGNSTAGRIGAATVAITGSTFPAFANALANMIGRALTAKLTNSTNADVLVHVFPRRGF